MSITRKILLVPLKCPIKHLLIQTVSNPTSSEEEAAALLPRHNPYNYNFLITNYE